jgi:hypothetical protein
MGFSTGRVWVMGFQEVMGYGMQFPAYQIGGSKMLWDKRGYGLSEVWVKRESTVSFKCLIAGVTSRIRDIIRLVSVVVLTLLTQHSTVKHL